MDDRLADAKEPRSRPVSRRVPAVPVTKRVGTGTHNTCTRVRACITAQPRFRCTRSRTGKLHPDGLTYPATESPIVYACSINVSAHCDHNTSFIFNKKFFFKNRNFFSWFYIIRSSRSAEIQLQKKK